MTTRLVIVLTTMLVGLVLVGVLALWLAGENPIIGQPF
jgi:hypothetical protein